MKNLFLIVVTLTIVSFSLSAQFVENPAGTLTTTDHVNIGGTQNKKLRVRHIDGKTTTSNSLDDLYLNWDNGKNVYVGNMSGNSSNLFVSGNMGVGTGSLDAGYRLTVAGSISVGGSGNGYLKTRHVIGKKYSNSGVDHLYLNWNTGKDVIVGHHTNGKKSDLLVSGKVRIGNDISTPAGYQLYVKGGILTERVKVAMSNDAVNWADYVFEEDYDLNEIAEVESFVKTNKHLPNVPSAKEVGENGVDMVEMDATLLRQIEELWLHVIEMDKEIQTLKAENESLKSSK